MVDLPPAPVPIGGGAAGVPSGEHVQYAGRFGVMSSTRSVLSWGAGLLIGDYFDGHQRQVELGLRWNASRHLQLSTDATLIHLAFPSRAQVVNADIFRFRAQYARDTRLSADVFVQYNRVAQAIGSNARLRYQFSEGRDLWLVYNDNFNTERDPAAPGEPRQPLSQHRLFLIMYVHTFAP
jgi:hypothetical protein